MVRLLTVRRDHFHSTRVEETVEVEGHPMTFRGWTYPLQDYAPALEDAGFVIEAIREPVPTPGDRFRRWALWPQFMNVRARKGQWATSRRVQAVRRNETIGVNVDDSSSIHGKCPVDRRTTVALVISSALRTDSSWAIGLLVPATKSPLVETSGRPRTNVSFPKCSAIDASWSPSPRRIAGIGGAVAGSEK